MNETQAHWEEHYGERDRVWSGRVNVQFADVVADLTPGRALDLGCGEGADAVWLAERGWNVVAVDISETALGRAREAASYARRQRPHRVRSARPVRRLSRWHVRPDLVAVPAFHGPDLDRTTILAERRAALSAGRTAGDRRPRLGRRRGCRSWIIITNSPAPKRWSPVWISVTVNSSESVSMPSRGRPSAPRESSARGWTTSSFCVAG